MNEGGLGRPADRRPGRLGLFALVVAAEDGAREDVGLEGAQVLELLADADELDGDAERLVDRHDDAALGGAVELGEHHTADVHGLLELLRLAQEFKQAVDVSGVVLTKLDGTAKGGIVVATVSYTHLRAHETGRNLV